MKQFLQRSGHADRRVRTNSAALALFAACLLAGTCSARAEGGDGDVSVGGEHILTVRFAAGGLSIKERADAITERLNVILADPNLKAADIRALPAGSDAKIMVKDKLLVTVDSQTAKFNTSKPLQLAQAWADHLRKVLPRINVKPNPRDEDHAGGAKPNR